MEKVTGKTPYSFSVGWNGILDARTIVGVSLDDSAIFNAISNPHFVQDSLKSTAMGKNLRGIFAKSSAELSLNQ
jgi:hypothetical protein